MKRKIECYLNSRERSKYNNLDKILKFNLKELA